MIKITIKMMMMMAIKEEKPMLGVRQSEPKREIRFTIFFYNR